TGPEPFEATTDRADQAGAALEHVADPARIARGRVAQVDDGARARIAADSPVPLGVDESAPPLGPGQDVGARLGRVVAVQDLPRGARHHYEPGLGQLGPRLGEVGRIRVVVPVQRALEPERVLGLLLRIVDRDHPDPRPRIVLALHRLPDPGAALEPGDAIARRLRAWRLPVRAGDRPRGRRREHLAPV